MIQVAGAVAFYHEPVSDQLSTNAVEANEFQGST
jgi:hypothetical protein